MATDKRARQRENRAVKQAELNKQKRREKVFNAIKRVGVWIVTLAVLIIVANLIFG